MKRNIYSTFWQKTTLSLMYNNNLRPTLQEKRAAFVINYYTFSFLLQNMLDIFISEFIELVFVRQSSEKAAKFEKNETRFYILIQNYKIKFNI
jgi:hypothetical protein